MDYVQELTEKSKTVNNLLTQYIDLHNVFIRNTSNFWSIFKKIDFNHFAEESNLLLNKVTQERDKIKQLQSKDTSLKEKEYINCLYTYTKSLVETIYLLFVMFNALREKAEGKKLNFREHLENSKKYQESINACKAYGDKLNVLYHNLTT